MTSRGRGDFNYDLPTVITAAHELKSPLALVRQAALLLEQTESSDERARLTSQIQLTAERALRLTSDLTRAARLDDAMFDLEPINPLALCTEIVQDLSNLFREQGRELSFQSRKHPLLLVANRDLLRRIVTNFADNALNYAGDDGAVRLQVQVLRSGQIIRIGVRDFGPGLSSDMWRKLQRRLVKQDYQAVHQRPQSSGLGLYIADRFAEVMGGQIGALRHRDGATFYVDLPSSRQTSLL